MQLRAARRYNERAIECLLYLRGEAAFCEHKPEEQDAARHHRDKRPSSKRARRAAAATARSGRNRVVVVEARAARFTNRSPCRTFVCDAGV